MNAITKTTDIISNWQPQHERLFGEQILHLRHRLIETGLFSREAVARLIEICPDEHLGIEMRKMENGKLHSILGLRGKVSGKQAIEAIERGKIWMNIRRVMDWAPEYRDLLDRLFNEIEGRVPGLETFKRNIGVLVSSPGAEVLYHADIQGQGLWQIEGTKRVSLYPNTESFIASADIEKILLRETTEDVVFKDWYQDYVTQIDLKPGEMLTWPLFAPHRVHNHDCLNISVTTEHWTREIWNAYAVHYGNGVLRRTLGGNRFSTVDHGLHVYPKAALAFAWKKLGRQVEGDVVKHYVFELDADADTGVVQTV